MHLSGTLEYILFAAAGAVSAIIILIRFWSVRAARRLTIASTIGSFILLLIGAYFVKDGEQDERTRVRSLLEGFAPTYAGELEAMGHWKLSLSTPADDPTYLSLIEAEKRWLKQNPAVADIYTFKKTADGKIALLVDSETDYNHDGKFEGDRETRTSIGEIYDEENDLITNAFAGKAGFDDMPYTDRWGTWVSAAAPLYGPDGSVEAVLGIDYPAEAIQAAVTRARHAHMLQGGVLIILLQGATVLIAILRRGLDEKHRAAAELEQQKEELKEARDEAEHANHATSEFVAAISHQLRTPLVSMLSCTELLDDQRLTPADRKSHVESLRRNGEHLLGMVDDLIDLDNVARGTLKCESNEVNLPALFEEVAAIVAPKLGDREFSIAYETAIHRSVRTDAKRLRQALISLSESASTFGDCKSVSMNLSLHGPRLRIDLVSVQAEKDVCALVEDVEATSVTIRLASQLVRIVGGTLRIPKNPSQPFRIEVPMNPVDRSPMVSQRPALKPESESNANGNTEFQGLKILVAEDAPESQKLIEFLLRGANVEIVGNGRDAVGKVLMANLEGKPFDVVILDIEMPVMTGLEASSTLREKGYLRSLIALTGDSSDTIRTRCLAHGFNDIIAKPINRRDLAEKISTQMKRRKAA